MEAARSLSAPLGRISISPDAIAQIVGHTVATSYGIVGMSARGRVGRLLSRNSLTKGVEIGGDDKGVAIDVYVVVEHGLNLAEVASGVRNRLTYEVERLTGLRVSSVDVHIQDVRRSKS
jgi:uncharacterized alkaline shock family protein YloU